MSSLLAAIRTRLVAPGPARTRRIALSSALPLASALPRAFAQALARALALLLVPLLYAAAQSAAPAPPAMPVLDSARLMRDISALAADSMEGRGIGTPGGERARRFLLGEIARIGLDIVGGGYSELFSAQNRAGGAIAGVNLAGVVIGSAHPERYIVVSAHYDHLGVRDGRTYNGADDNASGAAGLLALAGWFRAHRPQNSMLFVWFDGEEAGELGSKAFVASPPVPIGRIVANVNLDMVSRSEKGELWAAGASPWPVMKPLLESLAAIAPVRLREGHDAGADRDNWIDQSDQGSFNDRGIPFVYFGVEDHPDYHKPTDVVEHMEPGFYHRSVRTIAEFVRRLDLALDGVALVRARRPGS